MQLDILLRERSCEHHQEVAPFAREEAEEADAQALGESPHHAHPEGYWWEVNLWALRVWVQPSCPRTGPHLPVLSSEGARLCRLV